MSTLRWSGGATKVRPDKSHDQTIAREVAHQRNVIFGFGELDELGLAYATTIHKSQGSEYPAVVIPRRARMSLASALHRCCRTLYSSFTLAPCPETVLGHWPAGAQRISIGGSLLPAGCVGAKNPWPLGAWD